MTQMDITIDREKCKVPAKCRKCLEVCPQAVFKMHLGKVEKYKEAEDEDWHLEAWYWPSCSGCMECIKNCPLNAIKIKARKVEGVPKAAVTGKYA